MHLLHRHIFFSVLTTCLAAVGLFTFVLLAGNALRDLLGYALAGQMTPGTFGKLMMLLVPYVGAFALHIGILTGVLLVLGRLSGNSEITAMRAAGLSLGYIARPVWFVAGLGALVALIVNFYYMPLARTAYRETLVDAVRSNPLRMLVPRTFVRDFPGVVVYVGSKEGAEVEDFWIWELDDAKRVTRLAHARSGRVEFDEAESKLVLVLENVSVETRNEENPEDFSTPTPIATLDSMAVDLKLDNLLGTGWKKQKLGWLTLPELLRLRGQATGPEERVKVQMVINDKAANALGVLAFAILGVPLGIKVSRKETSANLGLALGLLMTYYFFSKGVIGWLEGYPALRPDLLVWLPPLVFSALGLWLFRRLGRN
ncbi:MAG: LptF/LptG family permease [Verrucomicrobiota bacterium]